MANLSRSRHGSVPLATDHGVRIADHVVDFERYEELMRERQLTVIERVSIRTNKTSKLHSQASKALICGRIVKQNSTKPELYERAIYCCQQRLCVGCYTAAHSAAVAAQMAEFAESQSLVGQRLVHAIFTTPRPQTAHEESYWTVVAKKAKASIRKQLTRWQRRRGDYYQFSIYDIGLHLKFEADTGLLWPHLHLAIVVNEYCQLTDEGGLITILESAYHNEIDDAACPRVRFENVGIIKPDRQLRPGRTEVTLTRTANLLAYAGRNTEDDDTPVSLAARDKLLQSLGISCTHTRSRRSSSGSKIKKARLPHEFPPDRLGATQTIVFPFNGGHFPIPADQYAATERQLLMDADAILRSQFSIARPDK